MDRQQLGYAIEKYAQWVGGTRESCIKIKDFIENAQITENGIQKTDATCVTTEEFLEALRILMAYSYLKYDEIPTRWHCKTDCKEKSRDICLGTFNVKDGYAIECPFYKKMG